MNYIAYLLLGCLVFSTNSAFAQEWSRFRGPNGSGLSDAKNVPFKWTTNDFKWKTPVPGRGHSSPVLWGKRIFVTSADEKNGDRLVLCFDADNGDRLWKREFPGGKHRKHRDNSFASATPVADERHVYVTWGNEREYLVMALNHDGKEIWQRDLGPYKAGHGFGASPIVFQNIVVVPNEQNGPSSLVALDCKTGDIRWQTPRKSKASYSTPCLYQPQDGPPQLIFTNYEHGVTGIDPESGKPIWELDIFDKGHLETAISSPVIAGDWIVASCGWLGVRQEVIAVAPPNSENAKARKLHCFDRSMPLCTTPLVKDGLLFAWSDKGIVSCASLQTGKVHWRKRVVGGYYSSPVCIGNNLYNVSREGDVVVLAASKEFKQIARNPVGEGSHATPAVARGRLYVRTMSHLICIAPHAGNTKVGNDP